MTSQHGRINSLEYLEILRNQVHPMAQVMFPEGNAIFQDDTAPIHSARIVMEWHDENSNEDDQLVKPKKSPDLNIIENSWSV